MATASSLAGAGRQNAFDAIAAAATDSVLVAASGSSRVRVHSVIVNQGDTTPSAVTFGSKLGAGATTAIAPPLKGSANGGFVLADNEAGWFQTLPGEGLVVTTGAGSTTGIIVTYSRVN